MGLFAMRWGTSGQCCGSSGLLTSRLPHPTQAIRCHGLSGSGVDISGSARWAGCFSWQCPHFEMYWAISVPMPGHQTAWPARILHLEMPWCPSCIFWSTASQLRISHGVTTSCLYLSSSPCKSTGFTYIFIPIFFSMPVLTLLFCRKLCEKQPNKILLSLCASLLGLYITFVVASALDSQQGVFEVNVLPCYILAGFLHYFTLTSLCWMGVEGLNMYLLFIKVINVYIPKFMLKVSLAAWGKLIYSQSTTYKKNINF